MLRYTTEQLASLIALPVVTVLLCWTIVIFHKNRNKWGPYDIPIVSVLVLSVLRNATILGYTLTTIFKREDFNAEYCSIVTWLFNSIHTFQASSLTTIAVIGLFSAKLHRKNQGLKNYLTSTHIIYHLFCLTTLCACVGVAAILAQKDGGLVNVFAATFDVNPCSFLPFELDLKFNIFIMVLHIFLAAVSFGSFLLICYNYYKMKKHGFDYIKKSNSDLSELSNNYHGINTNVAENRGYYDTYTIQKHGNDGNGNFCNFGNSEVLSNNSTTVSSTNSRRPCIIKQGNDEDDELEIRRTGLETMHPVLIVCYLFYHIPLIILCIYPNLIHPWPVAGIALWLGLVQDLLIPIGLGIVDSRFCNWVTNVYRCSSNHSDEKLPQVGLDGKFRAFGLSSPPQSMDAGQQDRNKSLQAVEHRFPITNGSLYTSIDGRLPVIHNYRRHKEFRTTGVPNKQQEIQSSNVALHSSYLNRREIEVVPQDKYQSCSNCETDQCPSHSDLHHLSPQYVNRKLSFLQGGQAVENSFGAFQNPQNSRFIGDTRVQRQHSASKCGKRLSQSQESINHLFYDAGKADLYYHRSEMNLNKQMVRNPRNLLRINKMRLSRSEDSLSELQVESIVPNLKKFQDNQQPKKTPYHQPYSSDEEDCFPEAHLQKEYDSMSSCNSITTEANCDFEFFQSTDVGKLNTGDFYFQNTQMSTFKPGEVKDKPPKQVSNVKITRSSSKRSLENFQAFVEETSKPKAFKREVKEIKTDENVTKIVILQRSNSYTTLEDRRRRRRGRKGVSRSSSKVSNFEDEKNRNKKIKSVECLVDSKSSGVFIEDWRNNNATSSIPDFKKVFISEYI